MKEYTLQVHNVSFGWTRVVITTGGYTAAVQAKSSSEALDKALVVIKQRHHEKLISSHRARGLLSRMYTASFIFIVCALGACFISAVRAVAVILLGKSYDLRRVKADGEKPL